MVRLCLVLSCCALAACHDVESWQVDVGRDVLAYDTSSPTDAPMIDTAVDAPSLPNPPTTLTTLVALAHAGTTYTEQRVGHALVTYVTPEVFFVQSERNGPAIVVEAAAPVVPGDAVSFVATRLSARFGVARVTSLRDLEVEPTNLEVDSWAREVSSLDLRHGDFASELVRFRGGVRGELEYGDAGYLVAPLATPGMPSGLELRGPEALMRALDLHAGCTIEVGRAIIWQADDTPVRPTVFAEGDLDYDCPPRPANDLVAPGTIVINEVGAFVELFNRGDQAIDLGPYALELVGTTHALRIVPLGGVIAAHGYVVVATPYAMTGVRLVARNSEHVVDAVLFGITTAIEPGLAALGEGVPSTLTPTLGRCPDHSDTDDNAWDFAAVPYPSPGETNGCYYGAQ